MTALSLSNRSAPHRMPARRALAGPAVLFGLLTATALAAAGQQLAAGGAGFGGAVCGRVAEEAAQPALGLLDGPAVPRPPCIRVTLPPARQGAPRS